MNARAGLVIAAVLIVIAGALIVLNSGEPTETSGSPAEPVEATGDVVVAEGPEPPPETELADIVEARVRRRGEAVVFRAEMGRSIPQRVKGGTMSWRWDVYEGGPTGTWILSADLNVGPTASLTSTQSNYGSSTFDDTLPGKMVLDGDALIITLRPGELEGWPDDFEWTLGTELDGEQGNPRSALATDMAPDGGRGTVVD